MAAYRTPNLLAKAVQRYNGLIHNNHPSPWPDGRDQWDYDPSYCSVITNTEMYGDTIHYEGKAFHPNMEQTVRDFLNRGGKTGFVRGTDTHEGNPAA